MLKRCLEESFKESPRRTRLCFRVCSQARRLLHYSGDAGLLLMVLLITAACCLSEDWLGIKQSASTYTPHISSSVINAALSHLERVLYIRSQEQAALPSRAVCNRSHQTWDANFNLKPCIFNTAASLLFTSLKTWMNFRPWKHFSSTCVWKQPNEGVDACFQANRLSAVVCFAAAELQTHSAAESAGLLVPAVYLRS